MPLTSTPRLLPAVTSYALLSQLIRQCKLSTWCSSMEMLFDECDPIETGSDFDNSRCCFSPEGYRTSSKPVSDISQMDSILTVPVASSTDDTRIESLVPLIVIVFACLNPHPPAKIAPQCSLARTVPAFVCKNRNPVTRHRVIPVQVKVFSSSSVRSVAESPGTVCGARRPRPSEKSHTWHVARSWPRS